MITWIRNIFKAAKYKKGQIVKFETTGSYDEIDIKIMKRHRIEGKIIYVVSTEFEVSESDIDWYN